MGITAGFMVPHPPLIVQEIGRGEEKKIQKTTDAYREAARRAGEYKPDTIVVLSPHQIMYADYFHISPGRGAKGDFGNFRAKDTVFEVSYDTEFVEELCLLAKERNLPAGTMGERDKKLDHGTMVPLYFIDRFLKDYKIVRIGLSGLPLVKHYELGECIKEAAKRLNRKTVVVASGDLSHRLKEDGPYGYQAEGPRYDKRIMEVMGSGNFAELFEFSEKFCEKAGECGHRSFTIMAGTFDRTEVAAEQLSYEGPFGVGYGICGYLCKACPPDNRKIYYFGEKAENTGGTSGEDAERNAGRNVWTHGRHLCLHQKGRTASWLYRNHSGGPELYSGRNRGKCRQCRSAGPEIFAGRAGGAGISGDQCGCTRGAGKNFFTRRTGYRAVWGDRDKRT